MGDASQPPVTRAKEHPSLPERLQVTLMLWVNPHSVLTRKQTCRRLKDGQVDVPNQLIVKLMVPQLIEKFPAFQGTKGFVTIFTTACHLSISRAKCIQSTTSYCSLISILILSYHLRLLLPSRFFTLRPLPPPRLIVRCLFPRLQRTSRCSACEFVCLWLQIQRFRVRSPALPDFLSSSGSGTGSTQPREVKLRSYLNKKVAAPSSENRD